MTVWGLDFCPPRAFRTLRFGGNRDPATGSPEIGDFHPPEMIFSPAGSIFDGLGDLDLGPREPSLRTGVSWRCFCSREAAKAIARKNRPILRLVTEPDRARNERFCDLRGRKSHAQTLSEGCVTGF